MGLVLMQQGGYAEAERAFREAITLSPDLSYATAGVAHVLALSGRRREAEAMVAELEARAREHYVTPVALCIAHLGLRNVRSEEHTSELQSQSNLVCRLLLEKKKRT